jgi:hypothetical protein
MIDNIKYLAVEIRNKEITGNRNIHTGCGMTAVKRNALEFDRYSNTIKYIKGSATATASSAAMRPFFYFSVAAPCSPESGLEDSAGPDEFFSRRQR